MDIIRENDELVVPPSTLADSLEKSIEVVKKNNSRNYNPVQRLTFDDQEIDVKKENNEPNDNNRELDSTPEFSKHYK